VKVGPLLLDVGVVAGEPRAVWKVKEELALRGRCYTRVGGRRARMGLLYLYFPDYYLHRAPDLVVMLPEVSVERLRGLGEVVALGLLIQGRATLPKEVAEVVRRLAEEARAKPEGVRYATTFTLPEGDAELYEAAKVFPEWRGWAACYIELTYKGQYRRDLAELLRLLRINVREGWLIHLRLTIVVAVKP